MCIAGGIILHDVAGDENRRRVAKRGLRVRQRAFERGQGCDAAQRRVRIAVEMRVCELDESRGHCAEW